MSKKILIIDDDKDIVEIFQMMIEANFRESTLTANNEADAEKIYDIEKENLLCVICDYNLPGATGAEFFQYVMSRGNIPFLLTTGLDLADCEGLDLFNNVNPLNRLISKPIKENELIDAINEIRAASAEQDSSEPGVSVSSSTELSNDEDTFIVGDQKFNLSKMRFELLERYIGRNPEVFLKLAPRKFVRILNVGQLENMDELQKYKQKNEYFCYIHEDDFKKIRSQFYFDIKRKFALGSTDKSQVSNLGVALENVHDGVLNFGVNKEQIELVNQSIESCISNLSSSKSFSSIIDGVMKDKGYPIFCSINALLISQMICNKLKILNDFTLEKFTYACMLHDIGLTDSSLSSIIETSDPKFDMIDREQKEMVKLHTVKSAELCKQVKHISSEVITMILEHHEKPDGSGFPRGLTHQRISAHGSILILSLKVADFFYMNDINDVEASKKFKQNLITEYDVGGFKEPLQVLLPYLG